MLRPRPQPSRPRLYLHRDPGVIFSSLRPEPFIGCGYRSAYNTRSPCWVTEFFTVARRDTWDRSHASPTFLVDGTSVQPPPIVSSCRRSNSPLSAAELFRLLLPHLELALRVHRQRIYSTVISTSSENFPAPTFISGHSSVVNIF